MLEAEIGERTDYLIQAEAAELLRLSSRTLERLRVTGDGPAFCRLGRRIVYRRADLERWATSRRFHSTSEADLRAQRETV